MVSPHRFKYDGVFSNELNIPDLITCVAFDSDSGDVDTRLAREAVSSESFDGRYKRTHQYKYTETFGCTFTLTKSNFGDFTQEEVRAVLKWLTQKDTTSLLEVYYDDSNVVSWASIGGFVNISLRKLANHRTAAIVAEWDSIHPFCLSDIYGRNADNSPVSYNTATQIRTTMYYWTTTTVSGTSAPQYVLTNVQTPKVGTKVYSLPRELTNSVIDTETTFYGAISTVNADGSYKINDTVFKLIYKSTKTQITYGKITINIDTDDNKPVYPKITINHGYKENTVITPHTIVPLPPHITFNSIVDMADRIENTVYHNDVKEEYYWKTTDPQYLSSTTKPNYDGWTTVNVTRAYTSSDEYEDKTFYYYDDNKTYYWLDPYNFHIANNPPSNFDNTGVKIINQHYDFLGKPSTPTTTIIKNNNGTEKIELDGANKIISSTNTRRIFGDDFNWQWLPLYDGTNEITIEGNCEVNIEYRCVRKTGEY